MMSEFNNGLNKMMLAMALQLEAIAKHPDDAGKVRIGAMALQGVCDLLYSADKRIKELQEIHRLRDKITEGNNDASVPTPPVTPKNWKLVPSCLTPEMKLQMHTLCNADCPDCGKEFAVDVTNNIEQSWGDMLAAAPTAEGEPSSDQP
ncbi:hypothetical protein ACQ8FT_004012 [Yersinia enterocolitica]